LVACVSDGKFLSSFLRAPYRRQLLQDFNSAQNVKLVPPTLALKKAQEHSIRRKKVQDGLSRHAFHM